VVSAWGRAHWSGRYGEVEGATRMALERDPHDIMRQLRHVELQRDVARTRALCPAVDMQTCDWTAEVLQLEQGDRGFFAHDALEAVPQDGGLWSVRTKRAMPKQTALVLERVPHKADDSEALYHQRILARMRQSCQYARDFELEPTCPALYLERFGIRAGKVFFESDGVSQAAFGTLAIPIWRG
jgi:hypothetical protein